MKKIFKKISVIFILTLMIMSKRVLALIPDDFTNSQEKIGWSVQVKVGDTISDIGEVSSGQEYTYIISFDNLKMPENASNHTDLLASSIFELFFMNFFESGEWKGSLVDVDVSGAAGIPLFNVNTSGTWSYDEVSSPVLYYTTANDVPDYPFEGDSSFTPILSIWKKWEESPPDDISKITGIFVDMRFTNKYADGTGELNGTMFVGPGSHFEIAITMKAPEFGKSQIGTATTNAMNGAYKSPLASEGLIGARLMASVIAKEKEENNNTSTGSEQTDEKNPETSIDSEQTEIKNPETSAGIISVILVTFVISLINIMIFTKLKIKKED